MKFLITCNENSQTLLDQEITANKSIGTIEWLSETEAILSSKMTNEQLVNYIRETPIIFIRHLFEIKKEVSLEVFDLVDLPLDPDKSFSFQIVSPKHLRDLAISHRNKNVDHFKQEGFKLDVKNPEQIVSLYFADDVVYVGLGNAALQLSKWSQGMIHFSKEQGSISRAEFKLREVFETFKIPKQGAIALDLGAAPGGWSQVLSEHGYNVLAVDPAHLDKRLKANKRIKHYQMTSQEFIKEMSDLKFDVMVNDMKMTIKDSIRLFEDVSVNLNKGGFGIITLKLPKEYGYSYVNMLIKDINKVFDVQEARQLFHNRHEITVLLTKKHS